MEKHLGMSLKEWKSLGYPSCEELQATRESKGGIDFRNVFFKECKVEKERIVTNTGMNKKWIHIVGNTPISKKNTCGIKIIKSA